MSRPPGRNDAPRTRTITGQSAQPFNPVFNSSDEVADQAIRRRSITLTAIVREDVDEHRLGVGLRFVCTRRDDLFDAFFWGNDARRQPICIVATKLASSRSYCSRLIAEDNTMIEFRRNDPTAIDTPAEAALALNVATYIAGATDVINERWTDEELLRAHQMYEIYAIRVGTNELDRAIQNYTRMGREDHYRLQTGTNPPSYVPSGPYLGGPVFPVEAGIDTAAEAALALNVGVYVASANGWAPKELERAYQMFKQYSQIFGDRNLKAAIRTYTNIGPDDLYRLATGRNRG